MLRKPPVGGFTVVELVVVMVLLGILSITAIPYMIKPSSFTPATLSQLLISNGRLAAQTARAQPHVVVSLLLERGGDEWQVTLQRDGAGDAVSLAAHNVRVRIMNDTSNLLLGDGEQLRIQYNRDGVFLAAAAATVLQPELGIGLTVQGDSLRHLCLYPNGYLSARSCS